MRYPLVPPPGLAYRLGEPCFPETRRRLLAQSWLRPSLCVMTRQGGKPRRFMLFMKSVIVSPPHVLSVASPGQSFARLVGALTLRLNWVAFKLRRERTLAEQICKRF